MSEPQPETQAEPTMEEILSSIRRIISDDDDPAAAGNVLAKKAAADAAPAEAETEAVAVDEFEAVSAEVVEEPADDVLELTQVVNDDGSVTEIDAESEPEPEDEVMFDELVAELEPEPVMAMADAAEPAMSNVDGPIIGDAAARATVAALNQLVIEMPKHIGIGQGLTLEEITRELLRPLLKQWLDANLPATVERLVQEEITRVSRLHR